MEPTVSMDIDLDDMDFDPDLQCYTYGCRCGGQFSASLENLHSRHELYECSSCSTVVRVHYISLHE